MITPNICSSSFDRNLHFTLGTPLSVLEESESISNLFEWNCFSLEKKEFYAEFTRRIQVIRTLLKKADSLDKFNVVPKWIYASTLASKVTACVQDFFSHVSNEQFNLKMAQKIYALAQDLKRHESGRRLLWDVLPAKEQIFLHHMSVWTEDLSVLKQSVDYEWLGDGRIERAKKNGETIADFGNGQLFKVKPSLEGEEQGHFSFPLAHYPGYKVVKVSASYPIIHKLNFSLNNGQLDKEQLGRIAEIFNVEALEQQMKVNRSKSTLVMNQFLDVFSCYRSGLCSVLNLSVPLPFAIGRQGEWAIWSDTQKQTIKEVTLSPSMVADIHRFFHIERMWKINVMNHSTSSLLSWPTWTVCEKRVLLDGILPLPTFLTKNLEERHESFLSRLQFNSAAQAEWNKLEKVSKEVEKQMTQRLHWMKVLVNQKSLTVEDVVTFHPQALLVARLLRTLDLEEQFQLPSPLTLSFLTEKANKMLACLLPEANPVPYTSHQAAEGKGKKLTDQILETKKQLKVCLLLAAIENFEKKASTKEAIDYLISLIQDKCEKIAPSLNGQFKNWPLQEKEGDHFMLGIGQEMIHELAEFLKEEVNDQEQFYNQLFLLRSAVEYSETNLNMLNQKLQSVLHDAMVNKHSQLFFTDMQKAMLSRQVQ